MKPPRNNIIYKFFTLSIGIFYIISLQAQTIDTLQKNSKLAVQDTETTKIAQQDIIEKLDVIEKKVESLDIQDLQGAAHLVENQSIQDSKDKPTKPNNESKTTKAIITLLSTGIYCAILDQISHNTHVQRAAGLLGLSPAQLNFVSGLTGSLYALDLFGVEGAGELAGRVPLATLTLTAVNSDWFQKIVKGIPLVGQKIGCLNNQREGHPDNNQINNHEIIPNDEFQLRRGLQFIAAYKTVEKFIPNIIKRISNKISNFVSIETN